MTYDTARSQFFGNMIPPSPPSPNIFAFGQFANWRLSRHIESQSTWREDRCFLILVKFRPTTRQWSCKNVNSIINNASSSSAHGGEGCAVRHREEGHDNDNDDDALT
jgi:hypothetical protein